MCTFCLNVCVLRENLLRYMESLFVLCVDIVYVCVACEHCLRLHLHV